jgi:anti-sigma B factor antagonist
MKKGHHSLDREDIGNVTVVRFRTARLRGEEASREVFHLLYMLVDEAGRHQLVVNLAQVEALDSSAIGKLVLLNRKVQAAGGKLALCGLNADLDHVFQAMHLKGVLGIHNDEAEALRSIQSPAPAESAGSAEGPTAG